MNDSQLQADRGKVLDTFKTALCNISVLNFVVVTVMYYPNTRWLGSLRSTGLLPTFGELVLQIWAFKIIEEFGNYYGHRLVSCTCLYYIMFISALNINQYYIFIWSKLSIQILSLLLQIIFSHYPGYYTFILT